MWLILFIYLNILQKDVELLREKIHIKEKHFIPFKNTMLTNNNQCLDLDIVPLSDEKRKFCDNKK